MINFFFMVFVSNENFDFFLEGGETSVKMNEFHFASNAPNFIGCGPNLMIHSRMCQMGKQHSGPFTVGVLLLGV